MEKYQRFVSGVSHETLLLTNTWIEVRLLVKAGLNITSEIVLAFLILFMAFYSLKSFGKLTCIQKGIGAGEKKLSYK